VDDDTLVERTAAAVAEHYRSLDLSDAAGLLLANYWDGEADQLAPVALALTEVHENVGRDGEQEELGWPELAPEAAALCERMNERILAEFALGDAYWLALAAHMHRVLGLPVLVDDAREPWPVGFVTELGRNPLVVAGTLPRGAVAAAVQDRNGAWHDAAAGPGAWLCVLPERAGQDEPAVRYTDVAGAAVDFPEDDFGAGVPQEDDALDAAAPYAEQVLRGARVPALWPRRLGSRPGLYGWDGDRDAATALGLAGHGCRVWIAPTAPEPRAAFVEHLVRDWGYGHETAERRAAQTPVTDLPGSLDGRELILALAAPAEPWMRDEGWAAVAHGDGFAVTLTGYDDPPERLDLVAWP
jgi:hypothetical protein